MKKQFALLAVILIAAFMFTGCADAIDVTACTVDKPAGFWRGLWNGITAGFSFISSLFNDNIAVYNMNNNGGWYDFGFVLGAAGSGGSATAATKKRR